MLEREKICDMCCSWIEHILNNDTMIVKINNCVGPYFMSHKGVR
jgi:hypothetical protein